MKRTLTKGLRNITGKRGSVLFIVLITMAALIALATGVLYAVNTEYNTIVEQANQEQLYQITVSANNYVYDYLNVYLTSVDVSTGLNTITDKLTTAMMKLGVNQEIIFDEAYFKHDMSSSGEPDASYAYQTIIKKTASSSSGNVTNHVFEITTTGKTRKLGSDWDPDTITITQVCAISSDQATATIQDPEKYYLVSFGSVKPDPSKITGPTYTGSYYFASENLTNTEGKIAGQLSTFGNAEFSGNLAVEGDNVALNIGKNYTMSGTAKSLASGNAIMRLGGTFTQDGGNIGKANSPSYIYMLGESDPKPSKITRDTKIYSSYVFINGDLEITSSLQLLDGCTYFVNGDVIVTASVGFGNSTFYISGDLYLNGNDFAWSASPGPATFNVNGKIDSGTMGDINVGGTTISAVNLTKYTGKATFIYGSQDPTYYAFFYANQWTPNPNNYTLATRKASATFEWGTLEAWPVYRNDMTDPTRFPLAKFETITECYNELNSQCVQLIYDSTTGDIKYDTVNGIKLHRLGKPRVLSSDPWIEVKQVVDHGTLGSTIATLKFEEVVSGATITRDNLSRKILAKWDPEANMADWISQSKMDPAVLAAVQGNKKYDLSSVTTGSTLTITESGQIHGKTDANNYNIIIDTSAGPGIDLDNPITHKDIYLKLMANNGGTFTFHAGGGSTCTILVRGAGSVIFYLDNGVDYDPTSDGITIMHEALYKEVGSKDVANATTTINTMLHPRLVSSCPEPTSCVYCKGQGPTEVSKGSGLLRQDSGSNIIHKYGKGATNNDDKLWAHNNIFIVNNNTGRSTFFRTGASTPVKFGCYLYGLEYELYMRQTGSTTPSLMIGGMTAGTFNTAQDPKINIVHLMPCDYYKADLTTHYDWDRGIVNDLVNDPDTPSPPGGDTSVSFSSKGYK